MIDYKAELLPTRGSEQESDSIGEKRIQLQQPRKKHPRRPALQPLLSKRTGFTVFLQLGDCMTKEGHKVIKWGAALRHRPSTLCNRTAGFVGGIFSKRWQYWGTHGSKTLAWINEGPMEVFTATTCTFVSRARIANNVTVAHARFRRDKTPSRKQV